MFSDRIIWNETSKIAIENMRVSLFNFSSLLFLLSLFLIFMLLLMVMCCHGSVSPPPSTSLPARIINAFSDLFILCVWGGGVGQLLAGMIAEPAFLSEYTIFALDHSNRPKAAQVPRAVSSSSHIASSCPPNNPN